MTNDELVEVVDSHGRVERVVTRSQMRAENLFHRCVYVAVLCATGLSDQAGSMAVSSASRLIVHQRSESKDVCPGYWDLAFGGVCSVGESWESSALRELREESGLVTVDLTSLGPVQYCDANTALIGRAYVFVCSQEQLEAQLSNSDGEVVAFASIRLGQLSEWVHRTNVCADSAAVVAPALLQLINN